MKGKREVVRMCAGCGEMKPKKELVRVVKAPSNDCAGDTSKVEISLDLTGKKPGRGAYVCRSLTCLKAARKSRRFERAFSCKIPEDVYNKLEEELSYNE